MMSNQAKRLLMALALAFCTGTESATAGPLVNASADTNLVAGLDARVGPNVRLGDDPPALPSNLRAQAEPHIARDPNHPDTLAAVFQEGRYTDGGAVDCGYAISHDGGLTWSRALIPGVTAVVGGPYYRDTDPVAGFDLQGRIYLCTLALLDATLTPSAVILSRSTNGGASFDAPIEAYRSPNSNVSLDKNWMAINTFAGTPTAGRIVATYTSIDSNGEPIARVYSDDGGKSWSAPAYLTTVPNYCQGSQPVFLLDGKLAVVYWNFGRLDGQGERIEVVVSTNGGVSFSSPIRVVSTSEYGPTGIRSGTFLPSATGNRTNDSLYVVYQALYLGLPRILFTKSSNAGATWSAPQPITDNPTNTSVFNPAIAASPDGQTLTVSFYDGRVHPSSNYLVDIFLAQSFDGGATWLPNLRLTPVSTDAGLAPLTSEGYMLGDYLGIAPAVSPDVAAVPVWIDTRTGNPDPFIGRLGVSSNLTFRSWRAARFSLAQVNTPAIGGPGADPDHDGIVNALEYAFGLNPWVADRPAMSSGFVGGPLGAPFNASYQRLRFTTDLIYSWQGSTNLSIWAPAAGANSLVVTDIIAGLEDVITTFPANSGRGMQLYKLGVTLGP